MIDGRGLFTPVCPYTLSTSTVRLIIQIIESYEAVVYKKCHIFDIAGHCLHPSIVLSSRLCTEYLASAFALTFVLLVSDNTLSKIAEQNKRMSKSEEPMQLPSTQSSSNEPQNRWYKPTHELNIGPQRRKRMPAGRHLDAIKNVPEQPKIPLKLSEQLKAHSKDAEQLKAQSQTQPAEQ